MEDKYNNNHIITSINFTVPSLTDNSKVIAIRRSKNKINENKENIKINGNVKIQNKKKI